MARQEPQHQPRRWKRGFAGGVGLAVVAGVFATQAGPSGVGRVQPP